MLPSHRAFAADACEVGTGAVEAGNRALLQFSLTLRNVGNEDFTAAEASATPGPCGESVLDAFVGWRILSLDGVPVEMETTVLKKDGCVYDVVYDAPPTHFDVGLPAFRRVRDGLVVGPRRDRR
mgnify:CR=1 FL=1